MASGQDVNSSSPGSGFKDISNVVEIVAEIEGAYGGAEDSSNFVGDEAVLLEGTFDVSDYDELNYYVGGQGTSTSGGFNGGGDPGDSNDSYGGGGASDIRVGGNATSDRIFVAGAAGGQGVDSSGNIMFGGGPGFFDEGTAGEGETSSSGGPPGQSPNSYADPQFDEFQGASATFSQGGGGGGGFHAGGAGSLGGGAGGSSYYDESLAKSTPSTSALSDFELDGEVLIDFRDAIIPDFNVSPSSPVAGESVEFNEANDAGYYSESSLDWDLDTSTASGSTVYNTYNSAGDYNITLTVTDTEGYVTSITKEITVEAGARVDFDVPSTITQGFDTTFTDQTTVASGESIDSQEWLVDGSQESTNDDLTYNFDSPGQKTLRKNVVVNGIQYSKSTVITVEDAATVDFSFSSPVVEGIEEVFTDETTVVSGASRTSEQWVIDGTLVGSNQDLNYTFDDFGDFSVGKIVTVNGYDYSKGETVTVEQNTTANFNYSPDDPLINETVNFTDESVSPFNITSYTWNFGDGTTATTQNPSHTYTERGEYNVQLTVEDDEGQTDSTAELITVFSRKPTVETESASNIGDFEATLEGQVVDVGVDSSADVYFEYRETGASSWNQTLVQTVSETGSYSESISGLTIETEYEFRAVGENSEGTLTGQTVTFSTDDNTPPTVDSFTITPDPLQRDSATDVSIEASDEVGINEVLVEWYYDGVIQTSQTLTFSSANSISETLSGFYTPTQFGGHQVAITITDDLGSQKIDTINQTLEADVPNITLNAPGDQSTIAYSEEFDYEFSVSTGNSEATNVVLVVIDSNNNRVQEENVGSIAVNSSNNYTVAANQVESPNDYDWGVEVDYETNNFTTSETRSLTVSEPSQISIETGLPIEGGYGLSRYGEEGYGESPDEKGFNYFNAEGGLIFTGNSNSVSLYFRYRKQGDQEWLETESESYDV